MTICRKEKDAWVPINGIHVIANEQINIDKIEELVNKGIWSSEELIKYGLVVVNPFKPEANKRVVGSPSYVESAGKVTEVYQVEDIPIEQPPTIYERLGITLEEFEEIVLKVIREVKV